MNRCVVNVATTPHYQRGQARLIEAIHRQESISGKQNTTIMADKSVEPECSSHEENPYAFKVHALMRAADAGSDILLWCDSSIVPIQDMEPLWQRIERDGYWLTSSISFATGKPYTNYEWTADSAYPALFAPEFKKGVGIKYLRAMNRQIPHAATGAFGLNVKHDIGREFLLAFHKLAKARAFCGPWFNSTNGFSGKCQDGTRIMAPCGPEDVQGHRHDQTAASVLAWRLGMKLTMPPDVFSYPPGDGSTILLVDGAYE